MAFPVGFGEGASLRAKLSPLKVMAQHITWRGEGAKVSRHFAEETKGARFRLFIFVLIFIFMLCYAIPILFYL